MPNADDERWMSLALELAANGRGFVEPNPMVGAVLVRDGAELGRGWHKRFGGPHAEIEAMEAARAAGINPRGATLYVTLEPCCHFGKTPPCTEAILAAGIARVVAAMEDPDQNVAGKGFDILRCGGVAVEVGTCSQQVRQLLAAYIKGRTKGRPWVICKWAQTTDGAIANPPNSESRWISSPESRDFAHRLRGRCQGVCIGVGTVLADDPLLTNRGGEGSQPLRIVLDGQLRTPPACQLVATAHKWPTLIAATAKAIRANGSKADAICAAGVEILELPPASGGVPKRDLLRLGDPGGVDLGALLDELGRRQHTYLLVEGGADVLASFINGNLADELQVFICPPPVQSFGEGDKIPRFDIEPLRQRLPLRLVEQQSFGPDRWQRYLIER